MTMKSQQKFRSAMCKRVRQAREDLNLNRKEFAKLIGCEEASLQKYETRSPLPHHLIPKFCEVTGFDPWYLLTGQATFKKP